ncbi:dihydrolipoamide dehydrogenase [Candidatus Woesearchaeota archaeon]|nr:dihydrolipoamide dehydrogenase [Candidatus Woesearchaeota archaeon]|tara:strand:+ start:5478 stop:6833 length:1356 start_codon:yes stop_codon:yes gene_type:complete
MEQFDVIVVGAGSGLTIVDSAASRGLKVALVEQGPMGGTCLNRGCIPSKMLIHAADVAETIQNSSKFGIRSKISSVDFKGIVSRVSKIVDGDAREIEEGIREEKNITLFKTEGKFIGKKKMQVDSSTITADKIFIMAGTRPLVPPIEGLEGSGFLTSKEALRLKKLPKTLTIIGGGYIAAELAHFFGSLGTKVNILQRDALLIPREDQEVAETFTDVFRKKHNVFLGYNAEKVEKKSSKFVVTASHGKLKKTIKSDQLLLAVGRVPNSDVLEVNKAGIKTNERGYINTNDYLETSAKGIWAGGDIAGKWLFKHSANLEAQYMYQNAFDDEKMKVDYEPMPHAIFSSPQIAGVGAIENELKKGTYGVGKYEYIHTGMGTAIQDKTGFVKILVDKQTRKILGCHIIGTDASTLIHEVIVAMKAGADLSYLTGTVHIHPALPEVVQRAAGNVEF